MTIVDKELDVGFGDEGGLLGRDVPWLRAIPILGIHWHQ